jgi:hypothetical protein
VLITVALIDLQVVISYFYAKVRADQDVTRTFQHHLHQRYSMAHDGDAESQTNIKEQTPLLDDHQADQQPGPNGHEQKLAS